MTDQRGPFISDAPVVELAPKSPDAPVTASEIMGAHWTVDRQDITGQQKLERQKYGQIAAEIDAHDGVPALQSILMPRHGTPDLIAGNTAYDKDAIWRDVQRIRQTDPGFLDSTPARTAQEFDAWLLKRSKDQRATAQGIIARQSGLGQNALGFGTDIVTGFTDPVNLATLPIGGGGKTILQTMGREALINGLTETAELPSTVQHRAELGEQMSAGDMIADVGTAAIGGALLPGGLHVAGKALGAGGKALGAAGRAIAGSDAGQAVGRAVAPLALRAADLGKASDGEVAAAFSKAVPAEIRTPDQQAALHVLDRQSEIDAINPYVDTPTARDVHADRLQSALAALAQAGDPDGIAPPLAPRTPVSQTVSRETAPLVTGDAAVSTVMARIGQVENASGGGDVRNPRSSATGKYQFTDRTWLNSYKRELGANGLSDAQILALRADGAMQDRLMRSLTLDNARYLHSIGQPETAGNLYLAHFAGPGGARRILEAEASTPIERVLSADAIKANPFLHGKTAGDVVAWAHAKMGETPIADRLRLAGNGGDEAVRLAQQELDSANMEAALSARASGNADPAAPAIDITAHAVPYIDPSDEIALKPTVAASDGTAAQAGAIGGMGDAATPQPLTPRVNLPDAPVANDVDIRNAVRAYVTQTRESLKPEIMAERLSIERDAVKAALNAIADLPGIGLRQRRPGVFARQQDAAPRDLLGFLADHGGIRNDEGHDLIKGRNLPRVAPSGGVLIRSKGMSIDRARELAAEAGYFHDAPPELGGDHITEDDMLQLIEHAVSTPHYARGDLETATAREVARARQTQFAAARETIANTLDTHGIAFTPVEHLRAADWVASGELTPEAAIARVVNEHARDALDAFAQEAENTRYADLADEFEHTLAARDHGAGGGVDQSGISSGLAGGGRARGEQPGGAAADAREEAGLNGPVLAEAPGPSLDDPNGPAGKAIAESLTHDVKAQIAEDVAFTTAKGSTYLVHSDGSTSRDKSFHPEHGAKDQGPQPRSQATIYVSASDAVKLAEFQAQGGPKVAIAVTSDGRWGLKYLEGKDVGRFERRTVVAAFKQPAVGLTPVEIWKDGERVHFGNEITEIRRGRDQHAAALDPNFPARERQRAQLKADSPIRAKTDQESTIGAPLFDAVDQGNMFRLEEGGPLRSAEDVLRELDADDAAIKAARNCL
ncbi:hypothetical protein [Sphingomonas sp. BE137]|nr:hypothetical protein [Sphingomonas sp. BE137]MDR6847185.1 hypothetical protein [Sphingomonas sp. BE137]